MAAPLRIRELIGMALGLALATLAAPASAYPWMIRHGYTGCNASATRILSGGAGALTEYRTCAKRRLLLLRMRYGESTGFRRPDRTSGFLGGWVPLPAFLPASAGTFARLTSAIRSRMRRFSSSSSRCERTCTRTSRSAGFEAAGSIGYVPQGDLQASLTRSVDDNLVSREHSARGRVGRGRQQAASEQAASRCPSGSG